MPGLESGSLRWHKLQMEETVGEKFHHMNVSIGFQRERDRDRYRGVRHKKYHKTRNLPHHGKMLRRTRMSFCQVIAIPSISDVSRAVSASPSANDNDSRKSKMDVQSPDVTYRNVRRALHVAQVYPRFSGKPCIFLVFSTQSTNGHQN